MKKRLILCSTILLIAIHTFGQIGINTELPQGVFHVDSDKNTHLGIVSDDVVITSSGNLGIGTLTPNVRFDLHGTFRYIDGNEMQGQVLVSDANGNANWGNEPYPDIVEVNGVGPILGNHPMTDNIQYSGVNITLPAGSWQITFNGTYINTSKSTINVIWDLCSSTTVYNRVGRAYASCATGDQTPLGTSRYTHSTVVAVYFVTPTVTTTYGMWCSAPGLGIETIVYSGEGRMWAIPIGG